MNVPLSPPAKLRVIIVEDEPPARRRLRAMLESEADVEVVGECGDGKSAVDLIEGSSPDVVFLDIQIPELTGLEVIEAVGVERMPAVVFVTAFGEYAVRAFDVHAVDYLLKPFDEERLRRSLERSRELLATRGAVAGALAHVVAALRRHQPAERLPVRHKGRIRMLPVAEIDYVTAEGAYVRIHTRDGSFLQRHSIGAMEDRLHRERFARVHRSVIVNVERVRELEALYRGEFVMWLSDGTRLVTGRTYRARVQQLFGI